MKIYLGEFLNLINNHPLFDGDTISHKNMKNLIDCGFAEKDCDGNNIPTEKGRSLYNKLRLMTIDVEATWNFEFNFE